MSEGAKLTLIDGGLAETEARARAIQNQCYACFDMEQPGKHVCPACGETYSGRHAPWIVSRLRRPW